MAHRKITVIERPRDTLSTARALNSSMYLQKYSADDAIMSYRVDVSGGLWAFIPGSELHTDRTIRKIANHAPILQRKSRNGGYIFKPYQNGKLLNVPVIFYITGLKVSTHDAMEELSKNGCILYEQKDFNYYCDYINLQYLYRSEEVVIRSL